MPIISIIVPVYNVERIVGDCIESILLQSYTDFELILVVDGSPDNSLSVCESYAQKDERIRIINKENGGVSSARNLGILEAKGEWIVFVDSDDWVMPDYLSSFDVDHAQGIDMMISGVAYVNQQTGNEFKTISFKDCAFDRNQFAEHFIANQLLMVGFPICKAYRRDVILTHNILFNTSLSFHEDHIFVFDYMLHCQGVRLSNRVTYKYRVYHSESSLSSKKHGWRPLLDSSVMMLERLHKICGQYNIDENHPEIRRCTSFCYSPMLSAISAIYDLPITRQERKNILKTVLTDKQGLYNGYIPTNGKGKLILFMACKVPFIVSDLFFYVLHLYQNRNSCIRG